MNSMNKLKSCPFCGGEAEVFDYNIKCDFYEDKEDEFIAPYTVHCKRNCCFLGKDYETKEEAIEAWNRRADND